MDPQGNGGVLIKDVQMHLRVGGKKGPRREVANHGHSYSSSCDIADRIIMMPGFQQSEGKVVFLNLLI